MHDFLKRPINVGDYIFGGIGYGNDIWEVLTPVTNDPTKYNCAIAKLADGSGFGLGVEVKLKEFILVSEEHMTLLYLQK